jgi:hypothetical protein
MKTKRRSTGAAGKVNDPDWSLDVDRRAGVERQMVARGSIRFDADEQLERAIAPRVLGRRCDRVRLSRRVSVLRDEHGLTRVVVEGVSVQIEAHDACPWCGDLHVSDGPGSGARRDNSAMALRRARGAILRLVRRRAAAMTLGLALVVPAAWVEFSGRYDAWWITGLALIVGATGLAIFWTGLTGPSPDWIE